MSGKKYFTQIEQIDTHWTAQVVRRLSKHKTHVSKQQKGFASEADANSWAEAALKEFINTQQNANVRQGDQRKETEEMKRQRSARRAEKTEDAKRQVEYEVASAPSDTDADKE